MRNSYTQIKENNVYRVIKANEAEIRNWTTDDKSEWTIDIVG